MLTLHGIIDKIGMCKVCGDRASGKHYGVTSCDGCRGFFKRSIRRNLKYVCKYNGKCLIDVVRRNQCQACRLDKCLQVNMRREAVQHERSPRMAATSSTGYLNFPTLSQEYSSHQKCLPSQTKNIFLSIPSVIETTHLSKYERTTTNNQLLSNCFLYPAFNENHVFDEHTFSRSFCIQLSSEKSATTTLNIQNGLNRLTTNEIACESAAKLLFLAVKWTKSMPQFLQLTEFDQMCLLQNCWADLFIFTASQYGLSFANLRTNIDIEYIKKVIEQIQLLNIDSIEISYIKSLILFNPILINLISADYIQLVNDQNITSLTQRCSPLRLAHILLLLPSIKSAANPRCIQEIFFKKTIGDVPIENLLGNLIKS